MRKIRFAPDEYYHLYNRGVNKQDVFLDQRDYLRFIFGVLHYQSPLEIFNAGRSVSNMIRHSVFNQSAETIKQIIAGRYVEPISFALMPNHFHLMVREKEESGISRYMQRQLNSYTKYFNTRYNKSGHVFQGPFQAVHVATDEQLIYLSAYVHRNPTQLKTWRRKESKYPWSSYQDFIRRNRWGDLLKTNLILGDDFQKSDYEKAVEESGAKEDLIASLILE